MQQLKHAPFWPVDVENSLFSFLLQTLFNIWRRTDLAGGCSDSQLEGLEGKGSIQNAKLAYACPPQRKKAMCLDVQWSFLVNLEAFTSCPKEALKVDMVVDYARCVSLGVLLVLSVLCTARAFVSPALTRSKRSWGCFRSSKHLRTLFLRHFTLRTHPLWKSTCNWGSFMFK